MGNFNFDRFHAAGRVGDVCRQRCLPDLDESKPILSTFPTDIVAQDALRAFYFRVES